jgi:hypothetical protein
MDEAFRRFSWMQGECTPEQARAWWEQAADYLREFLAEPPLDITKNGIGDVMFNMHERKCAEDLLRDGGDR